MYLLATLALGSIDTGEMRPLYLLLLLLAIILVVTGCVIALVTLRNQRKNGQFALISLEQPDQETFSVHDEPLGDPAAAWHTHPTY